MDKPLFLFVGKSASGKSTIVNMLANKYGYVQVESYCTRRPRFDGERGHVFVTEEEFKNIGELAAYTFYNGNHYGTTLDQISKSDLYVVDVPGVELLLDKLKDDHRMICVLYFDASVYNRILRMQDRNDSDKMIISRLLEDEQDDWFKRLDSLVWHYNNIIGKNVDLYNINVNRDPKSVMELVLYYINKYVED